MSHDEVTCRELILECLLDFEDAMQKSAGTLRWLMRPKELAAIG